MARAIGTIFLVLLFSQAALAAEAKDALKSSVDAVLNVLTTTKAGDPGRVEKLYAAVGRVFDPEELAKRTLAANWEKFSADERQQFTRAFVKLLEHTYLRRIEAYTDEKVVFLDEAPLGEGRAEVSTKIVTSTKEVPIVYRLIKKSDWKVYDVTIEGVSLVQNYRNQFNQILVKESPAQLISRVESMGSAS
ncbi:ABC transporter substrate-binding protein [Fundidesulfovibrio agrisoli]|uniref:Tgt2/MlaC family protein n=1 Tax=Fundidesulfovibrio agrisoli TaxID=2922717 RepID=UPI001FAC1026|nr:ABC transporter substrate-binding protein [Fundidesulfovibrio agrisoli]